MCVVTMCVDVLYLSLMLLLNSSTAGLGHEAQEGRL